MSEDFPKLDPKIDAWRRQSGALTKANAKYRNSDQKWADQQTNPLREFLDTPVDPKDFVRTAERLRKFIESVNCDCDEPGYICERCALLGEIPK